MSFNTEIKKIMTTFLSWDCAYKSIAWTYLTINLNIHDDINKLCIEFFLHYDNNIHNPAVIKFLVEYKNILSQYIIIHDIGVKDILNGAKVNELSEIELTQHLSDFLNGSPVPIKPDTHIIIEHQPSQVGKSLTNTKSTTVAHQLAYHYISKKYKVSFIDPKLKNNIELTDDSRWDTILGGTLSRYKDVKAAKYRARKEHSKANFLHLLDIFNYTYLIRDIKKSYLDDVADATMQIFAHIIKSS